MQIPTPIKTGNNSKRMNNLQLFNSGLDFQQKKLWKAAPKFSGLVASTSITVPKNFHTKDAKTAQITCFSCIISLLLFSKITWKMAKRN